MKVSIPIGAASTLCDLKVWVEEVKPEVIGIPKGHLLTHIRQFNPWGSDEVWDSFRAIPILYGEEGDFKYKEEIIKNETK